VCFSTDNPSIACLETMLDTQMLQSFAPNATTYFTPTKNGTNPKEVAQLLLSFLDDALNAKPRTQVASLSWGADYVKAADLPIQTLEGYLKKLAAIGMTILVSSGDSGASGDREGCTSLTDLWPTVSPWVTSVGGTQLLGLGEDLETKEVSCSSSTSGGITPGGGFSGTWLNASTPSWQQKAVSKYLEENNATTFTGFPTLKTPYYNPGGRGYPDIAAYAAGIPILSASGNILPVAGTSISAPLMASLFTLANQKLLSDGYSLIGYANPMLYWMAENCPEAFNDITIGNNQFGEKGYLCQYGYPAAVGWDPVTGLGSINFNPFVECIKVYQDLKT
jgi:tripeptidyl-peptidase-1